ncbi:inositol-pentakisphosphate 2-kinase [Zophobas morio]|uniref:inositol-pentakisphosphate 2-kinase n=1 Tax=Zophobas morio TaxID=2755281 RepID=UPI003083DA1D
MFASNEFKIPSNWVYRGEGNCNVVISLPSERKILRIRKIKKTTSLFGWILNWITDILYWYCGSGLDDELRDLTFYKKIIRALIGSNFVCDAEQVFLSRKQVKILEEELAHQRPNYRKTKSLQYGRAALFDDYAFLPDEFYPFLLSNNTYSVEIKPKQGWVPFSERHFPKCAFCMNQYVKHNKGQIQSLSSYCPSDLFSGEPTKMIRAVQALVTNPQNNLKIFKNGQLQYSEDCEVGLFASFLTDIFRNNVETFENLLLEFCHFVRTCLLTNFESIERTNRCNMKLFCEWNNIIQESSAQTKLPKGCVLERILSVQMLDVEGNQYYYKLLGNKKLGEYDYVRELLKEVSKRPGTCLKCIIMMLGNVDERQMKENNLVLVPYLMSAIAKDCSLMITFKRIMETTSDNFGMKNIVSTKYGDFIVNVGVFDLYPKPVSTILKHKKKIKRMLDATAKCEQKTVVT